MSRTPRFPLALLLAWAALLTACGSGVPSKAPPKEGEVSAPLDPSIASFSAPEVVQADEYGEATATLSWAGVERATKLILEAPGLAPIELEPQAAVGSLDISLSEDTTFELIAENEAGRVSFTAIVRVAYLPTIDAFDAERRLVGSGESSTVHWTTSDAVYVELWLDGEKISAASNLPKGSHDTAFNITSTLELRAFNELEAMVTATLEVQVGAPRILDLQLSSDSLWLGGSTNIGWQTQGGSELVVSLDESGETLCAETEYAKIETSNCTWQPPAPGVYPLTLTLSNLSGVVAETAEVFAADGPLITLFDATPKLYTAGDELEVRWAVLGDPEGNTPNLLLEDDHGVTYPAAAPTDVLYTTLNEPGTYELRLRATTDHPDASPDHATIDLVVHPRPAVEFSATPAIFDDSVDDEVVLSWTTRDAETVVLYQLVDGSPVQLLEALGADREAGSYSFVPEEEERFLLVATNSIGGSTSEEVEVHLAPLEVLVVEAEPEAFAQGQQIRLRWVTRMADEVTIDAATKRYLLEETAAPYLDLPDLGGTRHPLTDACGDIDTKGCAQIAFPAGFAFPFGDEVYGDVWVYTPGFLSFTHGVRPAVPPANQALPTAPSLSTISLAPFWDSLGWDPARYPTGNIQTALLEEDGERIFVIQWRDIGYEVPPPFEEPAWRKASFNFEVVLREDGSFDFRYGEQAARDSGIDPLALEGMIATMGFQLPDQSDAHLLAYQMMNPSQPSINGSRAQRTFSYTPLGTLPLSGELVFSPFGRSGSFPITITATRNGVSHSKPVNLTVAHKPLLTLMPEALAPVGMGQEFRIGWRTSNAQALEVIDGDGTIHCTAESQSQIEQGLCALTEDVAGRYEYTVRATGSHGSVVERTVSVAVFGDFGVAAFSADADAIEKGTGVLLSWRVFEAASVILYANDSELFVDPIGADTGSFLAEDIEEDTVFKLVVLNDVGATDEATLSVSLWEVVFGLQPSATTVRPGDPITVGFDARTADGGVPVKVYGLLPLSEIPAPGDRYDDISNLSQAVDLGISQGASSNVLNVTLPAGFTFPYMGRDYSQLRVFSDGYVSFDMGASAYETNQELPNSSTKSVHLAPFWDDLHPRNVGKMHTALLDPETFVIQWSKMGFAQISEPQDLNFQLVLRRDGSFDYRYGTMDPHPTYRPPSGCYPNDCRNEVNGSAATIGYQAADGVMGHSYHFGGSRPAASNLPVAGGLGGKTLRYQNIEGSGTFTFHPQKSETFKFCADTAEGPLCKDLRIDAPFGIDAANLSKAEVGVGESVTLSWKSVGGKVLNILDGDTVVYTTSDPAEIDQGSAVLEPTKDTLYVVELLAGNRRERVQLLLEMLRASMTATVTPSTGPGSLVTLSWELQQFDPSFTLHVAVPMEEISNADFSELDLSNDLGAAQLIGANSENRSVNLPFVDFSFPYFGTTHSSIQVATDGYLGWQTGSSTPENVSVPSSSGTHHTKVIAPFWDDLHTRQKGRVLAKKIDADRYVIQWTGVSLSYGSSNSNQGDLNILVVLHRDGRFEFRYGPMNAPPLPMTKIDCYPASCESETNGASATIGYQVPGGVAGYQLHFGGTDRALGQKTFPGGLTNRAWRFTPHTSVGAGSVQLRPGDSTHYKICAFDPSSGEAICAPAIGVDVPWGIDLFRVNPAAPMAGQPITLSWSVQNLDRLRILANGVEIAKHESPNIPPMGSATHTPIVTTTYTLEGTSLGRVILEERVVMERAFDLSLTGPTGTFFPGEIVEVHWELNQHRPGDVTMITPMSEVAIGTDGEGAFVDVSSLAGAQELILSSLDGGPPSIATVPLPFSFPYLGTYQSSVDVLAFGFLSFEGMAGPGFPFNTSLPSAEMTDIGVHLAPFWDLMLQLGGGDSIWRYAPDADTLIIQWKKFSRFDLIGPGGSYDLNFQVVLRSDGSFDYRYGTMAPPPPPYSSSSCSPSSCVNEANGSSATIGYQRVDASFGSTLHYGSKPIDRMLGLFGNTGPDGHFAFPGGLSNRTFRYSPSSTGKARIVVGSAGELEVCGILDAFAACKSIRVEAVASPGELMFTELMIDPAAGAAAQ